MKIEITNISGQKTGKSIELNDDIFGIEPNDHAIYLTVKQYLANQRQGTHKSKEKGEKTGSTRKLHRQKGTGGSRKGSIKNPLYHSGGTIFGPKPRDYSFKLNKKVKDLARKSALSYKAKENGIIIMEDFKIDSPKTKNYKAILKSIGFEGKRTLMILPDTDKNIMLSSRNIPKTETLNTAQLNTYAIMQSQCLILVESSVAKLNEMMAHQ